MTRAKLTDDETRSAVVRSKSIAEVLRILGLRLSGGNYATIKARVKRLRLTTTHFTGRGWRRGSTIPVKNERPLEEILVENSDYRSTSKLKQRLLRRGLLQEVCYECNNQPVWNNKRLVLHLDHINGITTDNRICNLRLLCPNCHSQTLTYCGRNIGRTRANKSGPVVQWQETRKGNASSNVCIGCDKQVSRRAKRCKRCAGLEQPPVCDWPTNDELRKMVSESNVLRVSKKLGVSFNSVKKRLKRITINAVVA